MKNSDKRYLRKPPKGYTNSQWQEDFEFLKLVIVPDEYKQSLLSNQSNYNDYHGGYFQYQYYATFIKDVLSNIRSGNVDYCYYIYQISDLLLFEHERLVAEWLPEFECFKIHLNK